MYIKHRLSIFLSMLCVSLCLSSSLTFAEEIEDSTSKCLAKCRITSLEDKLLCGEVLVECLDNINVISLLSPFTYDQLMCDSYHTKCLIDASLRYHDCLKGCGKIAGSLIEDAGRYAPQTQESITGVYNDSLNLLETPEAQDVENDYSSGSQFDLITEFDEFDEFDLSTEFLATETFSQDIQELQKDITDQFFPGGIPQSNALGNELCDCPFGPTRIIFPGTIDPAINQCLKSDHWCVHDKLTNRCSVRSIIVGAPCPGGIDLPRADCEMYTYPVSRRIARCEFRPQYPMAPCDAVEELGTFAGTCAYNDQLFGPVEQSNGNPTFEFIVVNNQCPRELEYNIPPGGQVPDGVLENLINACSLATCSKTTYVYNAPETPNTSLKVEEDIRSCNTDNLIMSAGINDENQSAR